MKTLSRGLAIALLLGAAPAGILVAHAAKERGWGMSSESRARLQDGKLAAAKAALKLDANQEKLWQPIEAQIRAQFEERTAKRDEWRKKREERRAEKPAEGDGERGGLGQRSNMAERYEQLAKRLGDRAVRMKAFSDAFSPFFASLSDEQKAVLGPVMRDFRIMGGGRRGHGDRWARGGRHHEGRGWGRGPRGGGESDRDTPEGGGTKQQ